jgi:pimeloyl-ACP methyl ester carboxylesterase
VTDKKTVMIDTSDAALEVVLQGIKGPLIVMLPAGGRGAEDFNFLADELTRAGWRTAAVNPPGAGNSTWDAGISTGLLESLTLHDYAKDVCEIIKFLDGIPAVLLGHAWGSRVARCLAADFPACVRCTVLLAAGGKIPMAPEAVEAMQKLGQRLTRQERLATLKAGFFADASDPSAWMTGFWRDFGKAAISAAQSTPLDDWWSGGEAPTLVVQGKEDRCAPPENGHLLKETYGDRITVIDIDNAGHALLPEQPLAISQAVIHYLEGLPAYGGAGGDPGSGFESC